jgi:hypothetical protein
MHAFNLAQFLLLLSHECKETQTIASTGKKVEDAIHNYYAFIATGVDKG